MNTPTGLIAIPNTRTITVLSVSPLQGDHSFVRTIVGQSKWTLLTADSLFAARALLSQRQDISVVLSERDLRPGGWADILSDLQTVAHPPSLIVTSKLADNRLWSEVLNRGGWDVLAKPFDRIELLRSVKSAWDH